ncbi:hypothetical protein K443DRAFT_8724 [Laccaria amethystina LaAM-08-1]|uniref:Unplaced genomic scaffold K443scaffold_121, whole genome shotgun sequence n=1 Tax=Laccaria amethystina LaAM-08-1 TaxID=1095629 RepID=A0A0C9XSX7_9AGAR|nr:hypothetical protein K443DRAFT_8724 [Laccaria amethystina LaAM-08-1]
MKLTNTERCQCLKFDLSAAKNQGACTLCTLGTLHARLARRFLIATTEARPSTSYTGIVYVTRVLQYSTSLLLLFLFTSEAVYRSYTPLYGAYQSDSPYPTEHLVWRLTAPYYRPDGKDCHTTYLYGLLAHAGRYPLAQLHATAKVIEDMQRTGSMEEFEEMKRRSLEDVEELLGCAKACDKWARGFYEKARVHWIRRLDVIRDRLQNRLHNLGYTQKDTNAAFLSLLSRFSKAGELSRLTRRAYKSHQLTLPPSTWVDLPPTWALQDVQPFSELLMEPTDRVLEKSDFTEVLKASVDEIKQVWRSDQRNRMGGMIPPSTQSSLGSLSQADSDSADEIMNIPPPPPAPVDLATSIFYCPGCVKRYKYTSNTFLINPSSVKLQVRLWQLSPLLKA